MTDYNRIVTHDDFDGLICGTICSHVLKIEEIEFAGPRTVTEARITITEKDVVCDLPYPLECGMWFDHHEGNYEGVKYRGINPEKIKGRFEAKKSCARVVFEYFGDEKPLPNHFTAMVNEADIIDSFDYSSIEDWRRETPGKIIDNSIKMQTATARHRWAYLRHLIPLLRENPLDIVADRPEVRERHVQFQDEEKSMMVQLGQNVAFLAGDDNHTLIILDLTHHKRQLRVIKNLAFLLYPEAEGIIEMKNMFRRGTKTNDLSISMSLSLHFNSIEHNKDVGEIMRQLNIGSGHKGAGAGILHCTSKKEMLDSKGKILKEILKLFQSQ